MRTLKLTLAYDGAAYAGWQRQDRAPTIQALLEEALAEIEGHAVVVHGAGRTDAGVHALGQVASVQLAHRIDGVTLVRALNAKLPEDIRVLRAEEASVDFHARFGARRKVYRYWLGSGPIASPFDRHYAWHLPNRPRLEDMRQAATTLCGTHDFAAFHTAGGDMPAHSTVRTLFAVSVNESTAPSFLAAVPPVLVDYITIDITGDGFLRHMVRTIAGTLVEVGLGRRTAGTVAETLASRRRPQAGPTAPSHGLFLVRIEY